MALFMDIHELEGSVSLEAVADAHAKDLEAEGRHGVHYQRYWVDEAGGRIFCLAEAPSAEAAAAVHRDAHGLVANQIFEVREGT